MSEYHLETPLSEETVRKLNVGDVLYINGKIYGTPFQWLSKTPYRIVEAIKKGEKLPVDLKGQIFTFYTTTSARYQASFPEFIKYARIAAITGKGSAGQPTLDALKTYGCVYLSGIGGSADVYTRPEMLLSTVALDWPTPPVPGKLLLEMSVKEYGPLFVTMDSKGRSVETEINIKKKMPEIYKRLDVDKIPIPYHV